MDNELIGQIKIIENQPDNQRAMKILRLACGIVHTIMKKRNWKVGTVEEFIPDKEQLLGINMNKGQVIKIRIRTKSMVNSIGNIANGAFLSFMDILHTLLHELVHIKIGPHTSPFYTLFKELIVESELIIESLETVHRHFVMDILKVGNVHCYDTCVVKLEAEDSFFQRFRNNRINVYPNSNLNGNKFNNVKRKSSSKSLGVIPIISKSIHNSYETFNSSNISIKKKGKKKDLFKGRGRKLSSRYISKSNKVEAKNIDDNKDDIEIDSLKIQSVQTRSPLKVTSRLNKWNKTLQRKRDGHICGSV